MAYEIYDEIFDQFDREIDEDELDFLEKGLELDHKNRITLSDGIRRGREAKEDQELGRKSTN